MAKERSDSTLGGKLQLHQQEQLITWLIEERISAQDAVKRVWDDFAVKTSDTAMYRFYQRHCTPRLLRYAREASDALPEASGGLTESWDESSEHLLKQKYFELLARPGGVDPKELIAFGQLIRQGQTLALKTRELTAKETGFRLKYEQKEREITLAVQKFTFDAIAAAIKHAAQIKTISADRKLSADEKSEQMRRLLFPQAFLEAMA